MTNSPKSPKGKKPAKAKTTDTLLLNKSDYDLLGLRDCLDNYFVKTLHKTYELKDDLGTNHYRLKLTTSVTTEKIDEMKANIDSADGVLVKVAPPNPWDATPATSTQGKDLLK